jgi:hypothetical protein
LRLSFEGELDRPQQQLPLSIVALLKLVLLLLKDRAQQVKQKDFGL